jgi:large subunit ribosomal protein L4
MEVKVLKTDGSDSGKVVSLPATIFGIEPNHPAMYESTRLYMANQRQGTAATKGRSYVKGSSRKLFRQKGTGGARRGNLRSPLMKGGGTMFGPNPRDYGFKVNKKVNILARKSALSAKASAGSIVVVEDFTLAEPSTKEFKTILTALQLIDKKVLMLTPTVDKNVVISGRNLDRVLVQDMQSANTYQLLNNDVVLLMESALNTANEVLNRVVTRGAK